MPESLVLHTRFSRVGVSIISHRIVEFLDDSVAVSEVIRSVAGAEPSSTLRIAVVIGDWIVIWSRLRRDVLFSCEPQILDDLPVGLRVGREPGNADCRHGGRERA